MYDSFTFFKHFSDFQCSTMVPMASVQTASVEAALGASRVAATCSASCIILNCDSFITYNATTALILPQVHLWKSCYSFTSYIKSKPSLLQTAEDRLAGFSLYKSTSNMGCNLRTSLFL